MTEWRHLIMLGVELIICSLLLVLIVNLSAVGREAGNISQQDVDARNLAKEYRSELLYDNTTLWTEDVQNLIASGKGYPSVWIFKNKTDTTATRMYDKMTPTEEFKITNVNSYFNSLGSEKKKWNMMLIKDEGGSVSRIEARPDDFVLVPVTIFAAYQDMEISPNTLYGLMVSEKDKVAMKVKLLSRDTTIDFAIGCNETLNSFKTKVPAVDDIGMETNYYINLVYKSDNSIDYVSITQVTKAVIE